MLELKNLGKIYCTKNGSPVKALENVNVEFPEKGMIFLLGRSGSGKSTLLNLIGGLDRPTEGEIILKGKSSKDFSEQDFDSYRNTYVGFVFQEYNVFNEFNVEENITLALELQKKPNDLAAVNALLNRVGLKGYNYRKPNTLSGGEKQRLAIARALIKNPEIILADEPTGALDSNTGRDVLDTLKELSEHKLVIVVSHDREYATKYSDRIIELKDGKVLKDVTKDFVEPEKLNDKVTIVNDETIIINNPKEITEKEIKDVVNILKKSESQVVISTGDMNVKRIKSQSQISDDGKSQIFKNSDYKSQEEYDSTNVKFIRSKLPLKRAFKMGVSSLRIKPIRLILTILLSVISFVLFGISSTCMMYDKNYSIHDVLKDSLNDSELIKKYYYEYYQYCYVDYSTGEREYEDPYYDLTTTTFSVEEMNTLNSENSNVDFAGVFNFSTGYYWFDPSFDLNYGTISNANDISMHPSTSLIGFSDCGEEYMNRNFTLVAGEYPKNANEIAISSYVYELYKLGDEIDTTSMEGFIGKTIEVTGGYGTGYDTLTLKVSGIYNVGEIPEDFNEIINEDTKLKKTDIETLKEKLADYLEESYNLIGFVSSSFYEQYKGDLKEEMYKYIVEKTPNGLNVSTSEITGSIDEYESYGYFLTPELLSENNVECVDLSGNKATLTLGKYDCLLSINDYYQSVKDQCSRLVSYYNSLCSNNIYDINSEIFLVNGNVYQATKEVSDVYKAIQKITGITSNDILKDEYKEYINTVSQFLNSYYLDTIKKSLVIYKAQFLISDLENPSNIETLLNAYQLDRSDENFNALLNGVNQALLSYEDEDLLYKAQALYDNALLSNSLKSILDKVEEGTQTETELEELKEYVNAHFNDLFKINLSTSDIIDLIFSGYSIDFDLFTLDTSASIPTIYYSSYNGSNGTLNVIGYYLEEYYYIYALNEEFINENGVYNGFDWELTVTCEYEIPSDAKYNFLITKTDFSEEDISLFTFDNGIYLYSMTNDTYANIEFVVELISILSGAFVAVAIVVGIFAALLLANFISVSINNKKKEIGILRAVGARKQDVFKIFFAESLTISFISVVISIFGSIAACSSANDEISASIGMKLLDFGVLNGLYIALIAIVVSLIATFIPVLIHAKKPPVEAIREL